MTASPISDLNPVFMASGCLLTLSSEGGWYPREMFETHRCLTVNMAVELILPFALSAGGKRVVRMDRDFFTGYRKTVVKPQEILLSIEIPYTKK
eukprot:g16396.t1